MKRLEKDEVIVTIWGMDSWSGKEVNERYIMKLDEAKKYVEEFNSKNNLKEVPEYYTYAEITY